MLQELINATRSRSQMLLGLVAVAALMLLPATPAAAQELLVDESGAVDAEDANARSDRDSSQKLEVSLVGTLQAGGASDSSRYGTVTVTLRSNSGWNSASQTYEIGASGNASEQFKRQLRDWVARNSGRKVYLKGHLHGNDRGRDYMHVEYAAGTSSPDQMKIRKLVGRLIDQRGQVFAGGEGTNFAVEATHNGYGSPIRFNLSLRNGADRIGKITIVDAPVQAWFITNVQFVIVASHYSIY